MKKISVDNILALIKKLDFQRVMGTPGEDKAFKIIKKEINKLNIKINFENFLSSWMEFAEAYIKINNKKFPIQPLISPEYNTKWINIPKKVEINGVLANQQPAKNAAKKYIIIRKDCDIKNPIILNATGQIFACDIKDDFIALDMLADGILEKHKALGIIN